MSFTYGTMFTGIGGFDLGLDHAGGECAWMFEKDDRARAVLRKQWPNTQIYDDAQEKIANLQPVDVLAFGSPCQDVSVAGERAGLLGAQSGLFFEGWRVTRQTKPRVVVFENVPGLLSSHEGRDFAVVLGAFTGVIPGVPVGGWGTGGFMRGAGPGYYAVAWRVLDARYFGVPQRRRRIFLVATLGNGGCAQILFEPETMQRHPRESGAEEEDVAATLESCTGSGGKRTTDVAQSIIVGDGQCGALRARAGGGGGPDDTTAQANHLVVYRLQNMGQYEADDVSGTKQARDFKSPTELVVMGNGSQECGTLCVGGKAAGFAGQDAGNLVVSEKPIAFSCKDHGQYATEDCSPTLRAMSNKEGNANGGGQVAIAFQPSIARGKSQVTCDEAATLAADYDQGDHTQHVAIGLNGRQDPVPSTGESGACDTDGHMQLVGIQVETFQRKGYRQTNASTQEANATEALRVLRKEIGEEAFTQWGLGISDSLQKAALLRLGMLCGVSGRKVQACSDSKSGTMESKEADEEEILRAMWEREELRRSSSGREHAEQCARQFASALSELSHEASQSACALCALWEASEGTGLLRQALSTLKAAWGSAIREGEPAQRRWSIRRLTPTEHEKLQGFPDDWTLHGIDDKGKPLKLKDGPRYRMTGNACNVRVVEWIAGRIAQHIASP